MESIKTELWYWARPGRLRGGVYCRGQGQEGAGSVEMDKTARRCLPQSRICIPSKAHAHATQLITESARVRHRGIAFGAPKIDLQKTPRVERDRLLRSYRVALRAWRSCAVSRCVRRGYFEDSKTLRVETSEGQKFVTYDAAIIAVGSKSAMPKAFDLGIRGS